MSVRAGLFHDPYLIGNGRWCSCCFPEGGPDTREMASAWRWRERIRKGCNECAGKGRIAFSAEEILVAQASACGTADGGMTPFADLPERHFRVILLDPPTRFSGGTKGRPQHYPRMPWPEILALPLRDRLHPEGARVFVWMSAPHMRRIDEICRAWRLRYSSCLPWIKLWRSGEPMFFNRGSIARGTGFEVSGNAEYVVILKAGVPHSIKGNPFPGVIIEPRREHSRKPPNLHREIEARIPGPYLEMFSREIRAGWTSWGNEVGKFDAVPAPLLVAAE